jgi:hypothetical protein
MQNKLKINDNWYFIKKMMMIYVNIKFNDETYKYIVIHLDKNSDRRYLTINEIFDDLKKTYVNSNKL